MKRKTLIGKEAREKILEGVNALADAVGSTLGPRGQNVAIDQNYAITVVHDGVTVAKYVQLDDPAANCGVRLLREAATKQVDEVGDGTTVVTILARAIVNEAYNILQTGVNAMALRKGIEDSAKLMVQEIEHIAQPIKTMEEKVQIATISAEDPELGKIIGELLDKMGLSGIITVEESKTSETFVEYQEGMQFDKGYVSPYFITDPIRMDATIENANILITDYELSSEPDITQLLPLMEQLVKNAANIVIIAADVSNIALATFILNKQRGINVLCVQAPSFENRQKDFLTDLAILTGGRVISRDMKEKLSDITLQDLGFAKRVTSKKDATLIVGGNGKPEDIQARIKAIEAQIDREEAGFEKEKLRERIGKLSTGVAVLKVGGHTEIEMKERKERALDAVSATRAAIEEGIVPGGETVYLKIANKLNANGLNHAERIVKNALTEPFKKLVENAGANPGEIMARLVTHPDYKKKPIGYDVTDGEFKDLLKSEIVDPARVLKKAIEHAVSVAIQILTTDSLIYVVPEEKEKK